MYPARASSGVCPLFVLVTWCAGFASLGARESLICYPIALADSPVTGWLPHCSFLTLTRSLHPL